MSSLEALEYVSRRAGLSAGDVLVVGAGPSGAATALLLSRAGHAVTVLDRAAFPRDKACGEGLMPPGAAVLARLGLLDEVLAAQAPRIRGVAYRHRGATATASAQFPMPPGGGERWGLGVRRTVFDEVLVSALRRAPRLTLLEGVRATGVLRAGSGDLVGVTTADGPLRARVVIGADGLHSPTRAAAGWTSAARGPGRYGLAGHWRMDVANVDMITVTFDAGQEWYQAPVGPELLLVSTLGGRRAIGGTARDYQAAARQALPVLATAELVVAALAAGQFAQRARTVAADGLFLVGDAAGYDDPTTGEGIGLGLLLAERLAAHLAAFLAGATSRGTAEARYRRDHARLWHDRRRVTTLALAMAQRPWLSRRAVARAADRPQALQALLGINCGYWGFGALTPRDWATLAGF